MSNRYASVAEIWFTVPVALEAENMPTIHHTEVEPAVAADQW